MMFRLRHNPTLPAFILVIVSNYLSPSFQRILVAGSYRDFWAFSSFRKKPNAEDPTLGRVVQLCM
jgi:hypothetical protein